MILDDPLLVARFREKVDKSGPVPAHRPELGPCWVWTAARNPYRGDYGIFWIGARNRQPGEPRGVTLLAHRVSWEIAHGVSAGEFHVLHRCDNPPCVRPEHLFLGTDLENQADMIRKGRRPLAAIRILTDADRDAMLALRGTRSQRRIARDFGVNQSTVSRLFRDSAA